MKKNNKDISATSLKASRTFEIRFSEVDSMKIVWHGSYAKYFEDAREAFGKEYGLGYSLIYDSGYYAPLVELSFQYKRPLVYGSKPRIDIIYRKTDAAKIVFDYEIYDSETNELAATGHSVQVFMDRDYELVWENPEFYEQWKNKWFKE
ncbi:MAG: acyl-CoA thioesterase [Muribaculaceae bacterium]|nr:acyl-CoA thioesterase [Muribaculaceae bacterium]